MKAPCYVPSKDQLKLRKVNDDAGRELPFYFFPASDPASSPLLICFHGWNSADRDEGCTWCVHPDWNILVPKDRFGANRMGCWWLGENGEYFMPGLLDRMLEEVILEIGAPPDLYTYGGSMGGFGALMYGIRYKAKAICANVPQVRLTDCEFATVHHAHLEAVFGQDRETKYADVVNFIDYDTPTNNPLYFIAQSCFDVHREYVQGQCLHLVQHLVKAQCCFSLLVEPAKGHYNVIRPWAAFALFKRWEREINSPLSFDSEVHFPAAQGFLPDQ